MSDPQLTTNPARWWWLSFVDAGGFRGVALVQAPNEIAAVRQSHLRKCNPGGEVAVYPMPPDFEPAFALRYTLLDRQALVEADLLDPPPTLGGHAPH